MSSNVAELPNNHTENNLCKARKTEGEEEVGKVGKEWGLGSVQEEQSCQTPIVARL